MDRPKAEQALRALLAALGHPTDSDAELSQTPERVVEAYANDLLVGEGVDVGELLRNARSPAHGSTAPVAVRDIRIASVCPHHLLPAVGTATVAYAPGDYLAGIGTLARVVDALARRLTLQEAIGERTVRALMEHLGARGAWCRLELLHTCLAVRGARQPDARVLTVATAGEQIENLEALLGGYA